MILDLKFKLNKFFEISKDATGMFSPLFNNLILLKNKIIVANNFCMVVIKNELSEKDYMRLISRQQYMTAVKIAKQQKKDFIEVSFKKDKIIYSDGTSEECVFVDKALLKSFIFNVKRLYKGLKGKSEAMKIISLNPKYLYNIAMAMGIDGGMWIKLSTTEVGNAFRLRYPDTEGCDYVSALLMPVGIPDEYVKIRDERRNENG